MPLTELPWTPEVETLILGAIKNGAFPYVAAEAQGIDREVLDRCLRRAARKCAPDCFRKFRTRLRQALAAARIGAEVYARKADPLYWLKFGPGKETTEMPGWSNPVKPPSAEEPKPADDDVPLTSMAYLTPLAGVLPPDLHANVLDLVARAEKAKHKPPTAERSES
jgi:hypothetical protein